MKHKINDRDPYKSGYRGIALCLKLVFIRYMIPVELQGLEQSTDSPRGLASGTPIAIAFT